MDYEKKYKEALELMKGCIPDKNGLVHIRPCDIFSELKESEDEKIRKDILAYLKGEFGNGERQLTPYTHEIPKWYTWLEKQGLKFKVGDLIINKDGNGKVKQILEATNSGYTTNDGFAIREIYEKNYRTCEIKDICQWKPSDAFIEKAAKWIEHNFGKYDSNSSFEEEMFIKEFIKAMKGE